MKIDENTPPPSNDSADSNNDPINPDVIAKNDVNKTWIFSVT